MRSPAVLLTLVLLALLPASASAQDVIVRYRSGTDAGERADARRGADVRREGSLPLANTEVVDPEAGVTAREAIAALERQDDVLYAEPDAERKAFATVPSDRLFGLEWGLRNAGQTVNGVPGTAGADIRATEAWDVTRGSAGVVVAVADTGIAADHSDLATNLYRNAAEANGTSGSDDDGNGYVDDVRGWDFVSSDATPEDADGHGTHVAGTIGARGNDGSGVAGVAWDASIMPLRVLGADGTGTVSDAIRAYRYAGRAGARIINLSLGGDTFSRTERDALAESPNMLVVAAAGNDGLDTDVAASYPCEYDLSNVICVAATDQDDGLAGFSNRGATSVDIAAPGTNIASTWKDGGWVYLDGTSMAAPHVSGAAVLALSRTPGLSAPALRSALLDTAEPLPSLTGRVASGGRLDAAALVGVARPEGESQTAPQPTPTPTPTPTPQSDPSPSPTPTPTPTPTPSPSPSATPAPTAQPQPGAGPTPSPAPTTTIVLRDLSAPMIFGVTLTRARLATVLRRGLRVRMRCDEPCSVRADLLSGRKLLARRTLRAASTDRLSTTLRPVSSRLGRLRSARRATLTVRLRATDPSGNARTVTRRITLRR